MSILTLLPLALLTLCLACGDKDDTGTAAPDDTDGETDTDSDSDTDTDTDTDADSDSDTDTDTDQPVDQDGDGYASIESGGDDCDDSDDGIHPGATEACNGVDDDCDPATSEDGVATLSDGHSYSVLQDAIADASLGDTVSVCAGTWAEALVIDRDLTVVGVEGATATIIDAGSPTVATSTVTVSNANAVLEGLTLTGGTGSWNDGNTWGGGLSAGTATGVELIDCVVEGNQADFGGGVAGPSIYPRGLTLTDTVIRDNEAAFAGGGFLIFHGALAGTEVSGNSAPYGGGGAVFYWDVTADADTVIQDNQASDAGGGVYIWDEGQFLVTGTSLLRNTAMSSGGAIHLDDGAADGAGCDLGTGADDNSPDDIAVQTRQGVISYTAGALVDFACSTSLGECTGL